MIWVGKHNIINFIPVTHNSFEILFYSIEAKGTYCYLTQTFIEAFFMPKVGVEIVE